LQHATVSCGNGDGGGGRHGHGHRSGQQHQQQQQQRLVPPSAPSRSGIISGGGGNGPNCPTDSKPDAGSPLLSISEVTNTLLNQ